MSSYLHLKGGSGTRRCGRPLSTIHYLALLAVLLKAQALASVGGVPVTPQATRHLTTTYTLAQAPEQLTKERPFLRDITVGRIDSYKIDLPSGNFLSVVIAANNIELAISVSGPRHRKVRESRARRAGPTPLSLISSAPGAYTIEVRAVGGPEKGGSYELRVDQLRTTTARDAGYLLAEKAIAEADTLREAWRSESLLQSIKRYEEAHRTLKRIGREGDGAYALKSIGDVYRTLGQNPKAVNYYTEALRLSRAAGNSQLEIETLNDIGELNIDSGNKEAISDCSDQARALSKRIGYVRGEARALSNMGGLFSFVLGDKQKGLDFFNQSLSLWQSIGDLPGQAELLTNLGYTHTDLGNLKQALNYFSQALSFWQAAKHRRGEARTLTAIGVVHCSLGDMQKAIDNHTRAVNIFHTIGDILGEAVTLNGIAYVYNSTGEPVKALELYKKALQLYKDANRRSGEAVTIGQIGRIYEALGEKSKALEYHNRRLGISRSLSNPRAEAHTLRDIGVVFDSLGETEKALGYYDQALSISRTQGDRRSEGYTLNCIGYVYDRKGEKERALGMYRQALELLHAVEDRTGETLTLHNIARVTRDLGDLTEAQAQAKALLGIVESLRTKVINQELRTSYFASAHQHYELYIDILMRLHRDSPAGGYDVAALEISEKARGRSLLDLLNEAGADVRQGVDQALLQQERHLQQLLNSRAETQVRLARGRPAEGQMAAIKNEIADLTSQYEAVLARIRSTSPRYAALAHPRILKLPEIQELLGEDTMLLEYFLGSEKSYLWAVTSGSVATFELPGRSALENEARRLYGLLASFSETPEDLPLQQRRLYQDRIQKNYSETAARLSEMLLAPVADRLAAKRLIIVADGALLYVPFAALPIPPGPRKTADMQSPLIVRHEIVNLPSISVIAAIRKEASGCCSPSKTLAVLADPVFERDDPRVDPGGPRTRGRPAAGRAQLQPDQKLPVSRGAGATDEKLKFQRLPEAWAEAMAISKLVPQADRMLALGFDANISTATGAELRHYRIIHFATHALIYGVHPQLYGIVLSLVDKNGNPQDGFLRLNEIYNLKLETDLVVLSACQTAIGKEIQGEGLVGLTRGFIYAGAPRVVASLWKVNDKASAELMKNFYEAMLSRERLRPAAALRAAQIKMWKQSRWNFPYYWAAFLLQGEWQ